MRIDLFNSAASQLSSDLSSQQVGVQAGRTVVREISGHLGR